MDPQATAQVRGSGSDGEIGVPSVLPRLVLRRSLPRRDRWQRLDLPAALAVSHTLNPVALPTFMFRHTAERLVAVPSHPN
jgi:hypothetical protein